MRNLELAAQIGLACGVIAFLFALTASSLIDDQSPSVTLRQEWAALRDTFGWVRPGMRRLRLRVGLLRARKGPRKGSHRAVSA